MSLRQALPVLLFAALGLACEDRVVDCETPGPWPPAHQGDPCDAPREAMTNSLDDPMRFLVCHEGRWIDPLAHIGKYFVPDGDAENGFCLSTCLADMDPDTPERDIVCSEYATVGWTDQVQACELSSDGWRIPPGDEACFAVAIGPPGAFDAMPMSCRERGDKTAFVIVGDTSAMGTDWTSFEIMCQAQIYADDECPGRELPETNCE